MKIWLHCSWVRACRTSVFPDPQGFVGLGMVVAVLLSHLFLVTPGEHGYIFSEDLALEALFHVWLLVGPPLATYLGLRHLFLRGDSVLPFISVPVGALMTLATAGALITLAL